MPAAALVTSIFFFLYGTSIGSFLAVCIDRLPERLSVYGGRSHCSDCMHILSAADLIPLVSFVMLKGRCRYCHAPIPRSLPLIEGLTGIVYTICYLHLGLGAQAILFCFLASALIVAAGIDRRYSYIPDRVPLFILLLAVLLHLFRQGPAPASALSGSLLVAGLMLLISTGTRGGIGGGDIKLFAAVGLILGFSNTMLAFFFGYVLGACYCIPLLLRKKLSFGDQLPMAPFFACSIMTAALWGEQLLRWYLALLA